MKSKVLLIALAAAAIVAIVAGGFPKVKPTAKAPVSDISPNPVKMASPAEAPAPTQFETVAQPEAAKALPSPETVDITAQASQKAVQKAKPPKEPLHDPDAREALTWVGADPEAEAYWLEAIFDPNLPAQEREDLMEDLNENGLSDPRHPGPEDVPLILNRLALIEEIAPYGDNFMQEHLGEAYKDLANLLAGEPSQ